PGKVPQDEGAFQVSGSPYHMAINSVAGSINFGSQDRALKASVVVVPDVKIEKLVSIDGGLNWYLQNDTNSDYAAINSAFTDDYQFLLHYSGTPFTTSNLHIETTALPVGAGATATYE